MKVKRLHDQDCWFDYLATIEELPLADLVPDIDSFLQNDTVCDIRARMWLVIIDSDKVVSTDVTRFESVVAGLASLLSEFFNICCGESIRYDVQLSVLANGILGLWDDLTDEQKACVNANCRSMLPLRNFLTDEQEREIQEICRHRNPEDEDRANKFFYKMKTVFDHLLWEAWNDGGRLPLPSNISHIKPSNKKSTR